MNILVCWEIFGVAVVAVSLYHTGTVVVMITAPSILICYDLFVCLFVCLFVVIIYYFY